MPKTPLSGKLAGSGGVPGEYRGVETPGSFGDSGQEFAALLTDCAIYDLGWKTQIIASGEDRVRWLNGMVTNNIKDLALHHGNYNFLLNAQGHILGDMFIYNLGDSLLIETDRSQREKISSTLERFIIMDDVELQATGDNLTAIGIQGLKSPEVAAATNLPVRELPALTTSDMPWADNKVSVIATESRLAPGYELWSDSGTAALLWDALVNNGATPVGAEAVETFRIAAGIPRYAQDIRERDLPQETAQPQALNFTKGCYIGQEIVERIHSRGRVHRRFTGFGLDKMVEQGAKLKAGDKDSGEITSVARVQAPNRAEKVFALGYIRREAELSGAELHVDDARAKISKLPFEVSELFK